MRPIAALAWVLVLGGCSGGAGERAREGGAPGSGAFRDPGHAVVSGRAAPVPEASDAREVLLFLRSGSVWMMKPDGSSPTQLTVRSPESPDEAPALSPRGDAIAWAAPDDAGVYTIHVMELAAMIPRRLTDGGGDGGGDTEPAWSPDGRRLVFVRGDPRERRDLYMVDAAGGEPQLLHEGDDDEPDWAGFPTWSTDGRAVVFCADRREGNGTTLWEIDVESRRLRRLTAPRRGAAYVRDQHPTYAPDGRRIAFASNRHVNSHDDAGDLDIYAVNPDGSGLTRLTGDPGIATRPSYSPDGKRLYFASSRSRENEYEIELYVMAAEGGEQRRLTRDERPQNTAPSAGLLE